MRSLRGTLLLTILGATGLVWLAAAAWFHLDARDQMREVLDARLIEAARMVGSLVPEAADPADAFNRAASRVAPAADTAPHPYRKQLSCQIWSLAGQLLGVSASAPEMALADIGQGFAETRVDGERWRVFALTDAERGVKVLVGERLDLREALVRDIAGSLMIPVLGLLPVLAAITWVGVGASLRPLRRLEREVHLREAENLEPLPSDRAPREVQPLIASINGLFVRLRQALEREQRLTGVAAHELRTPIAAMRAHTQVALAAAEPEVRDAALANVLSGCDRTAHLVEQLLTLSRLDAPAAPSQRQEVDVAALAGFVVDEQAELAPRPGARPILDAPDGPVLIETDPTVLEIALRNLVDNAVRYAGGSGAIAVTVEETGAGVRLRVSDRGPGIPIDQLDRVRERFFRSPGAARPGSGLGLSIVEQATSRLGGVFRIGPNPDGRGVLAELALPGAGPEAAADVRHALPKRGPDSVGPVVTHS